MLALIASSLLSPVVLLDALPNDGGGTFPLEEFKAKSSKYWDGDSIETRPAHVLAFTLRFNGPTQGSTLVAVPTTMEVASAHTVAKQNWAGIGDVLVISFGSQTDVTIHIPSAGHNPTGDITDTSFRIYTKFWYDPPGPPPLAEYTYSLIHSTVKHTALEDAGIDTRRTFLSANKVPPAWPPGPNSEQDYFKFGSWTYNGGLFAGTIQTPDRSGLGRTQFRFPTVTGLESVKHMTLSLFMMPIIEKGGNAISLGAYWLRPHGTLPGENDQNWENRFDVDPGVLWDGVPPNPLSNLDLSRKAIWSTSFPAFDEENPGFQEYANWQLTRGLLFAPWHDIERVCLATLNEDEVGGPFGYAWRSFASKEYNAEGIAFPHHDVAPRLWVMKTSGLTQH